MNSQLTDIDYGVGAYGKTIRIATQNKQWILELRKNILKLFNGDTAEFDICKLVDTKCSSTICELLLIRVSKSTVPCVTINDAGKQRFFFRARKQDLEINIRWMWRQDKEEIETLLGLIDGLLNSDSGHQYLAKECDGCIIELSYNERISKSMRASSSKSTK